MPRQKRCEFHGAIHLVTISGRNGENVFYDPNILMKFPQTARHHAPHAERFQNILWNVCEQYNACVHAYFLEPNAFSLVLQTSGAPLQWLMHDLLSQYSMYLREQNCRSERAKPFPRRYNAQIVQPAKLPYVVRYVQRREPPGDPRRRAINHPFSSNLIYCGRHPQPHNFVVSATREALRQLGHLGTQAYFEFMAAGDTPSITQMLSRRVIGDVHFIESVGKLAMRAPLAPSPDEILKEVTTSLLHSEPNIACASTHRGALARALVAWYAMRTGAAQIGAVAKWFGVTSSDLRYLIRRHRQRSPQYFSQSLSELFPTLYAQQKPKEPAPSRVTAVPQR